jgi:hypothetical protein
MIDVVRNDGLGFQKNGDEVVSCRTLKPSMFSNSLSI